MTAGISLAGVTKTFPAGGGWRRRGAALEALGPVDLHVDAGSFVSLIGPSGCGKSTLLRIVAGLTRPDTGAVSVLGEAPEDACAAKHIGLVPQTPALLPWRSVIDNVRLPLEVNRRAAHDPGAGPRRIALDPGEVLAAVGLDSVAGLRPAQLSGGMQQRVAIARAFVFGAPVLLMDEPFSALDELTREALRGQLLELWQAHRTTVLFVTHAVAEAVTLSDRVVVMSRRPGRVVADLAIGLPRPRPAGIEVSAAHREAEVAVRAALRAGAADAA